MAGWPDLDFLSFCLVALLLSVGAFCLRRQHLVLQHLRLVVEQSLGGGRGEAEGTRVAVRAASMETMERIAALRGDQAAGVERVQNTLSREQGELRLTLLEAQQRTTGAIAAQFEATRTLIDGQLVPLHYDYDCLAMDLKPLAQVGVADCNRSKPLCKGTSRIAAIPSSRRRVRQMPSQAIPSASTARPQAGICGTAKVAIGSAEVARAIHSIT